MLMLKRREMIEYPPGVCLEDKVKVLFHDVLISYFSKKVHHFRVGKEMHEGGVRDR